MKTDAQIQTDVLQELKWEPSVVHEHVGVTVSEGVVTLSGTVPTYIEKSAAEKATQRVAGVKAVVEKISVKPFGSYERDDESLAKSILSQFQWNVQIPDDKVKAKVEDGWVSLSGEVEWEYQRTATEKSVRSLLGVRGITNNILIKPRIKATDVKTKISEALKRAAEREANRIDIQVRGSEVVLSGEVRSFAELRDARGAAYSAPGVTYVENNLQVGSPLQ